MNSSHEENPHFAESTDEVINSLVPAASAGDARSLQRLIDLIYPSVVRYCRARVNSNQYPTAEDIAQEICLAVARALPDFVDRGLPFMAFVYRIAANKVVDARRVYSRDLSQPTSEVPDMGETVDSPETDVVAEFSSNEIVTLLDILNEKAREIIILRIFSGYSAEETARILGMTPGAVRVAQFRALAKLRKHIDQQTRNLGISSGAMLKANHNRPARSAS